MKEIVIASVLVISILAILTTALVLRMNRPVSEVPTKIWSEVEPLVQEKASTSRPETLKFSTVSKVSKKVSKIPKIQKTGKPRNVCETPACLTLAYQLNNWMDPKVDPCDNFYKYSCGNYIKHALGTGTRNAEKSEILMELIEEFLVRYHKNVRNSTSKSKSEKLMSLYYRKCYDLKYQEIFEIEAKETIEHIFADIQKIGPWPLMDQNWDDSKFDINEYLKNMADLFVLDFGIFQFQIYEGDKLELINENPEIAWSMVRKITNSIFENQNLTLEKARMDQDFSDVNDLLNDIDEFDTARPVTRVPISKLKNHLKMFDFDGIIHSLAKSDAKNLERIKNSITVKTDDVFFDPRKNIETVLKSTANRTIANLFFIMYINQIVPFITSSLEEARTRECIQELIQALPRASLRVFVRNHFDRRNLKVVNEMVEGIRESYVEFFKESTKINENTKKGAIRKVKMMKTMVGYPEEFEKEGALDKVFETIDFQETDSFYLVSRKIKKLNTEILMDFIAGDFPLDPNLKVMDMNAYYFPRMNYFAMLVPYLDEPKFDISFPTFAKFGSVGRVIGHEMGHGFDVRNRKFDGNGDERRWWPKNDSLEFKKGVECLKRQYENYDDPDFGKHLKGAPHINEIVADRHGFEVSYRTFQKLKSADEQEIAGFEGSAAEKMFFRIVALDFCSGRNSESLETILDHDHPTNSFRTNGILANMKSFADAYNCPVGSPMNPEKKCELL